MTGCSLHAACAISLRRVFLNANETDLCLLVEVSGQKSQRSSLGLCHGYIILLGHTPNLFHYSSLLNAYSENSYYEKAKLLMKDLRSTGLTPNKNQSVIQNQKPGWRAWEVSGILGGLMVWAKASGSLSQDGAVVELGDTSWVPGSTRCRPLGPSFGRAWWNADGAPSLGGARCRLKVPDMGLVVMDCFKPLLYH